MKYTQADIVYLAGFIDADGYFNIAKKEVKDKYIHYHTSLDIGSKNKAFVDYMAEKFETNFYKRNNTSQGHKYIFYQTQFCGERLLEICELILPYLIIKRRNCEIMIEMRKSYKSPREKIGSQGGSGPVSIEVHYLRAKLIDEIRSLSGAKGASKSKRHKEAREQK